MGCVHARITHLMFDLCSKLLLCWIRESAKLVAQPLAALSDNVLDAADDCLSKLRLHKLLHSQPISGIVVEAWSEVSNAPAS